MATESVLIARIRLFLLCLSALLLLSAPGMAAPAPSGPSVTWTVTVEADSGPGTLRYALEHANAGDIIRFDVASFPPATPTTIPLASELPAVIDNNLTIDASNAGVILDGSALSGTPDGLRVQANNVIVSGFEIVNFGGNGITVSGDSGRIGGSGAAYGNVIADNGGNGVEINDGSGNYIWGNWIGTDPDGSDRGNGEDGLLVTGNTTDNTIGGDGEKRNVISANGDNGVSLSGGGVQNNLVAGNLIGLAPDGSNALGNDGSGIAVYDGAIGNIIGGSGAAQRNVVSGNGWGGIVISTAYSTMVMANYVGLDATGVFAVPNAQSGVMIKSGAQSNTIGGIGEGNRNVIAGNSDYGIHLYGEFEGEQTAHNTVLNNYIGTRADNTAAVPNAYSGVSLGSGSGDNTIGPDNCIAGNAGNGIYVEGSDGNSIFGNRIGVRNDGVQAIPNSSSGVYLINARNNEIGAAGDGNVISGNGRAGVELGSGSHSNVVRDNIIGLNGDGSSPIANARSGLEFWGGAEDDNSLNTIGPDNVISGNTRHGVYVERAHDIVIEGNIVGLSKWGTSEVPNGEHGVMISNAYDNRIGNTVKSAAGHAAVPDVGNVISGNGGDGIHITGSASSENQVFNNTIGTEQDGTGDRANGGNGITVRAGAVTSRIGLENGRNTIVHNAGAGVWIDNADGNQVTGNWIGIDADGNQAGNLGHGVVITNSAASNFVGLAFSGLGNTISGNGGHGVYVYGEGSNDNIISNNGIGVNLAADGNMPNGGSGVVLEAGADGNQVGGDGSARSAIPPDAKRWPSSGGNVISGNIGHGVLISAAQSSVVAANYVGTDRNGAVGVGNGGSGVVIRAGATNTTVNGNLISGNGQNGLLISDAATQANTATANIIGLRALGDSELPNGGAGVVIGDGAHGNALGGNTISGNAGDGVTIQYPGSNDNVLLRNRIGAQSVANAVAGNGGNGVTIYAGPQRTIIGGQLANTGNLIAFNAGHGVLVHGNTTLYHTLQRNSIHDNGGEGIALREEGNSELTRPRVSDRLLAAGQVQGSAPAGSTVRIFSDAAEEGAVYEGATTAGANGRFTFSKGAALTGPNITATATDALGNTSEFGCYFADVDCDNDVDLADLNAVAACWNLDWSDEEGYDPACDLNGDQLADMRDIMLVAGRWGWPDGPAR